MTEQTLQLRRRQTPAGEGRAGSDHGLYPRNLDSVHVECVLCFRLIYFGNRVVYISIFVGELGPLIEGIPSSHVQQYLPLLSFLSLYIASR